jgi:hypothetical protein
MYNKFPFLLYSSLRSQKKGVFRFWAKPKIEKHLPLLASEASYRSVAKTICYALNLGICEILLKILRGPKLCVLGPLSIFSKMGSNLRQTRFVVESVSTNTPQ